jgi:hypothetical protein
MKPAFDVAFKQGPENSGQRTAAREQRPENSGQRTGNMGGDQGTWARGQRGERTAKAKKKKTYFSLVFYWRRGYIVGLNSKV